MEWMGHCWHRETDALGTVIDLAEGKGGGAGWAQESVTVKKPLPWSED